MCVYICMHISIIEDVSHLYLVLISVMSSYIWLWLAFFFLMHANLRHTPTVNNMTITAAAATEAKIVTLYGFVTAEVFMHR